MNRFNMRQLTFRIEKNITRLTESYYFISQRYGNIWSYVYTASVRVMKTSSTPWDWKQHWENIELDRRKRETCPGATRLGTIQRRATFLFILRSRMWTLNDTELFMAINHISHLRHIIHISSPISLHISFFSSLRK